MTKLLLVEDDESLAAALIENLVREGYAIDHAPDLASARAKLSAGPAVVLLDWMLPDGQGIDLLREIRGRPASPPVIFLTARAELVDRVLGLEGGADDYLTKPFETRELVARIRVQLRRAVGAVGFQPTSAAEELRSGDLALFPEDRRAERAGRALELKRMEFELLRFFLLHPDRVFSREELLNRVWGYENYPTSRTIDTHVLQLRQKIGEERIETVRGIGYRFKHRELTENSRSHDTRLPRTRDNPTQPTERRTL